MKRSLNGPASLLLLAAAQPNQAPPPARDLVAIGRLRNLDYELVNDPDDLLGHGWITAEFRIERIVRGTAPARNVIVRYFGHTYRGEDVPTRLRLRVNADGTYTVCAVPGGVRALCRC